MLARLARDHLLILLVTLIKGRVRASMMFEVNDTRLDTVTTAVL